MQELIPLLYEDFTYIRRTQNLSFYSRREGTLIKLFAVPNSGITICTEIPKNSKEWATIKPFANKPIIFYDKRVVSHDFANKATWPAIDNSKFVCQPEPGWKYILTHCISRFPKTVALTSENPLYVQYWLSPDNKMDAIPVVNIKYEKTVDLIRKTNTPMYVSPTNLPGMGTEEMVEITFVYADPFTFKGAPIIMRSSLHERVEIYLENNDVFRNSAGGELSQECNIMFNFKRTPEF